MMRRVVITEDHLPINAHIMKPVFINDDPMSGFAGKESDLENGEIYDKKTPSEIYGRTGGAILLFDMRG